MNRAKLFICLLFVAVGFGSLTQSASALNVPAAPPLESPVVDQTNTLTEQERKILNEKINAERIKTSNQIAVLIIPTLDGSAIEDYSLQVARGWGIGDKERNNGVLLLVAKNDRKLRIEVGYGLEGALPDARANQIIRNRITPEFKAGQYYQGIANGLDSILLAIRGEYDANLQNESKSGGFSWASILYGFIFVPIWLASLLARSKSWWAGGVIGGAAGIIGGIVLGGLALTIILGVVALLFGLLIDWLVSRNYKQNVANGSSPSWWAGGSSHGSGGGFGGGSFGGGGSSGSW